MKWKPCMTYTRDLPYVSILFTRVKFTCVHMEKLRVSGNPPTVYKSVPQFDLTPGSSTNQLFLARLRRFFLPCRTLFAGDLCLKIVTQLTKKFICSSLSMSLALCYCQGTKLFCQRSSLPTY